MCPPNSHRASPCTYFPVRTFALVYKRDQPGKYLLLPLLRRPGSSARLLVICIGRSGLRPTQGMRRFSGVLRKYNRSGHRNDICTQSAVDVEGRSPERSCRPHMIASAGPLHHILAGVALLPSTMPGHGNHHLAIRVMWTGITHMCSLLTKSAGLVLAGWASADIAGYIHGRNEGRACPSGAIGAIRR